MAEQDFININLDDVPDTGFPPWPEGVQSVRVVKVEKKQKEGSPYPYLNVSMQHADGKEECKGQIFLVLSFHPNALWNLKDFLKKAKVNWTKQGFNYSDLVGKTLRVTTGIEPSQRDPETIITVVKPPYHVG